MNAYLRIKCTLDGIEIDLICEFICLFFYFCLKIIELFEFTVELFDLIENFHFYKNGNRGPY